VLSSYVKSRSPLFISRFHVRAIVYQKLRYLYVAVKEASKSGVVPLWEKALTSTF
jgi:hypothetical protein